MRSILLSRWTMTAVGTVLLAALAWVFGPFLPVLESWLLRGAIILALLVVWGGANLLIDHRHRARDHALAEGVATADPSVAVSAEEAAAMRKRLSRAMTPLRNAHGRRGWLCEQPWYAIIGPPGAGKTTALLNAGLHFPLADRMGEKAVAGVGGTRLCDWWFTDEAVLIDTGGRYTTQDFDASVDRSGWETFLDLLRHTRVRQPLNGVIVAVALPDVSQAPREVRSALGGTIGRRLKEMCDRLRISLPVYVLFTKADLVAGFSEFFDDLDTEKRAQVWGTTFALNGAGLGGFRAAFHALVERLDARLLDRMQAEPILDRRALIAGFPRQMASLAEPLQEFLNAALTVSRLDPAPLVRGVYLCSGTQEGTPIDRLAGEVAHDFGIDQRRMRSLRSEHGRSYFLNGLLRQVVFGEAMLVSEPRVQVRWHRLLYIAGCSAILLAASVASGLLWQNEAVSDTEIDRIDAALARYQQTAARLRLDPVTDGDLTAVLPVLDGARDLPFRTDSDIGPGLSQTGKLAAASRTAYREALERILLPRLIWRLENQMRGALDQPEFLYQAACIYLMLGGEGLLDRDLVRPWMRLDWERDHQGADAASVRERLALHLDAFLAEPLPRIALDGGLVEAVRATFGRVPVAERIYSRIVPSAAAQLVAPWRPADSLGAAEPQLFTRISGTKLTDGIPGLYTAAGFRDVLLPSVPAVAKQVIEESRLLGKTSEIDVSPDALRTLEAEVVRLYEMDFNRQWDAFLADWVIRPIRTTPQGAQALFILGSPQSPMRSLLTAITQELALSARQTKAAAQNGATAGPRQVIVPSVVAAAPSPGQDIDAHYKALRDYIGEGPGAPIEVALAAINSLQRNVARLAAAQPGTAPPGSIGDSLLTLRAAASQSPPPVRGWLLSLADDGASLRPGDLRQ